MEHGVRSIHSLASSRLTRLAFGLALSMAGAAHGAAVYGFEDGMTGDWAGTITNVSSGGGVLGVASASGSKHAELTNQQDTYQTGYGGANYSFFGFATAQPYAGDFYQSIAVYIDPTLFSGGDHGFWIDMSPDAPPGNYGAEHNFRITGTGSSADVYVDGQAVAIASLVMAGWYNFEFTYEKGALPTDLVTTNATVKDMANVVQGSTTVVSNSPAGPLYSADLGGEGYVWVTVWKNGYSGDTLAIDNVQSGLLAAAVPEPTTLALVGVALAGLGFGRRKKA